MASSSRRLVLVDADEQDHDGEALPMYQRDQYMPHPSLSGKLRHEARSDAISMSDVHSDADHGTVASSSAAPTMLGHVTGSTTMSTADGQGEMAFPASDAALARPRPPLTVHIPAPQQNMMPVQQEQIGLGMPAQAYSQAQPPYLSVGKDPSTFACPFCGAIQQTKTQALSGDYTMMMSVVFGIFLCMWCVPYFMDSCKDVEHICGSCDRALSTWQRNGGKVVPARIRPVSAQYEYSRPMRIKQA
ncbi:LITAF-like zinc ribbon domain-containing protein [Auriculariales sp. MPI-PUGE-AT-0066]|nr:LITAF-like zinc ribbon domain-containing protein [Auriculariales sp. MPI-PUGE-AT-0066]